jgi:cell division protein FtsQ
VRNGDSRGLALASNLEEGGIAVLDTASTTRAPKAGRGPVRTAGTPTLRRDLGEDFAPRRRSQGAASDMVPEEDDYTPPRHLSGLRLRLRGGIPRSMVGRVLAGGALVAALGVATAGLWSMRTILFSNPALVLQSSSAIQITGNHHLTRAQLLTVFGEDVDRNLLTVSLDARRAELERLPWVEHATVMRLLPNRIRVAILERRPVAFVRQGSRIGMVDAHGVLLDMASDGDAPSETHYSFPVVTGISNDEPLSVRAARMKLFARFTGDLGANAKNVSEVDLSSPEDIKALIPDGSSDILVHFGDNDFLHRYELYQKNLPGWMKEYPKLASADMRYERQVVLEMQPNSVVPTPEPDSAPAPALKSAAIPLRPKKLSEMAHPAKKPGKAVARPKSTQAGPQ